MAARSNYATAGRVLASALHDLIVRRGIPPGVTPATIDVSSAEAFAPTRHTPTVQNRGADLAFLYGSCQTAITYHVASRQSKLTP